MRVFGCRAFVHIPKDERSKLDVKAKSSIFLGYGHEEFGYRVWDPMSRKIVRSRDIVFLKDQLVDDDDKVEKVSSFTKIPIRIDPIVHLQCMLIMGESYRKVMVSLKKKMALQLMMLSQLNKLMENVHYHH